MTDFYFFNAYKYSDQFPVENVFFYKKKKLINPKKKKNNKIKRRKRDKALVRLKIPGGLFEFRIMPN